MKKTIALLYTKYLIIENSVKSELNLYLRACMHENGEVGVRADEKNQTSNIKMSGGNDGLKPELPPKLNELSKTNADDFIAGIKKMPFFMTELDEQDDEQAEKIEALKAMAFEGEPHEVALNFKNQGNECYLAQKFHDAIEYYGKALAIQAGVTEIDVACYLNRAACNLELRNYRKCINDCKLALKLDDKNLKALYRSARAYNAIDKNAEAIDLLKYGLTIDSGSRAIQELLEKAERRQKFLKEQEEKRRKAEELKETKQRNFEMALQARKITMMTTSERRSDTQSQNLKVSLSDEMDPSSSLLVPILFLYPLELESDVIQSESDEATIQQNLEIVFESPPEWFQKSDNHPKNYALNNLQVFVQTTSGVLPRWAKIPPSAKSFLCLHQKSPSSTTLPDSI